MDSWVGCALLATDKLRSPSECGDNEHMHSVMLNTPRGSIFARVDVEQSDSNSSGPARPGTYSWHGVDNHSVTEWMKT